MATQKAAACITQGGGGVAQRDSLEKKKASQHTATNVKHNKQANERKRSVRAIRRTSGGGGVARSLCRQLSHPQPVRLST